MPAHDLRVLLDGLGRLGYQADALLSAAGLRHPDLENPDARVPCDTYGVIVMRACQERFIPNLAVELARVTPSGAWPLVDYLVATADTVDAGVRQVVRFLRITEAPFSIEIRDEVDPIRIEIATSAGPFAIEFEVALMIFRLRDEVDGPFAPSVSFIHSPGDAAGFERILGCPVTSNASWNGISLPSEVWRLPLRRRDPILRRVLEGHANEMLSRLPTRTGLVLEVQRALTSRVAGGDTRIQSIGREFAMSARTLQRRLADEGASYQKLLDDARKGAAGRYVTESTLAICEIAYLLGYSEPAPFHRAFKRWYGRTPEALRDARR